MPPEFRLLSLIGSEDAEAGPAGVETRLPSNAEGRVKTHLQHGTSRII